jgi:hypothetical protein
MLLRVLCVSFVFFVFLPENHYGESHASNGDGPLRRVSVEGQLD